MPTCPGCEHTVSYERLPSHLQYCSALDPAGVDRSEYIERFEARLDRANERLAGRIRDLEAQLERCLTDAERRDLTDVGTY